MKKTAIVCASGGMDSCVTAAVAAQHFDLAMLHVQYGQRTQDRETTAFRQIAAHFAAKHQLVTNLGHLKQIGGSSLTDLSMEVSKADLTSTGIPSSYVPFRNAHLLAIAVSWAEVLGCEAIFMGAVEEDSSGYPDCRKPFFQAFEKAANTGTKPGTRIRFHTPLIHLSKAQIVAKGKDLGAPLELTWSCYQNSDQACGECDSCALRLRGFQQAGWSDPIPYITTPG